MTQMKSGEGLYASQATLLFFATLKNREKTSLSKHVSVLILQVGVTDVSKLQPRLPERFRYTPVDGQPDVSSPVAWGHSS